MNPARCVTSKIGVPLQAARTHQETAPCRIKDPDPKPLDPDDPGDLATRDGWTPARHREWDDAFRRAFMRAGHDRYPDDERAR